MDKQNPDSLHSRAPNARGMQDLRCVLAFSGSLAGLCRGVQFRISRVSCCLLGIQVEGQGLSFPRSKKACRNSFKGVPRIVKVARTLVPVFIFSTALDK